MHPFSKRIFIAAAPLLLTACLWGPGKFTSELALKKDGSFVLDYRGEIVLQTPPDAAEKIEPWKPEMARCYADGRTGIFDPAIGEQQNADEEKLRACTAVELAKLKEQYQKESVEKAAAKRKENEEMAKMFGLGGLDDESGRAFAAKLSRYAGWRSVQYRSKGVFYVDYHMEGRATQDFAFPMLPDNDFVIPFVVLRARADGAVLVTAPAFTGGAGPFGARAGAAAAASMKDGPISKAQGRFTVITDGEVLTNNSEDGATPHASGRQLHWDVTANSSKIPETLVRLR